MMTTKHKPESGKKPQGKRAVSEIAPGVRVMLDAFVDAHNEEPERVSSTLKYTDVINLALDAFLSKKSQPSEEMTTAKENKPEKEKRRSLKNHSSAAKRAR